MELVAEYLKINHPDPLEVLRASAESRLANTPAPGCYWTQFLSDGSIFQAQGRMTHMTRQNNDVPIFSMGSAEPRSFIRRPSELCIEMYILLNNNRDVDFFYTNTWGRTFNMNYRNDLYKDCTIASQNAEINYENDQIVLTLAILCQQRELMSN